MIEGGNRKRQTLAEKEERAAGWRSLSPQHGYALRTGEKHFFPPALADKNFTLQTSVLSALPAARSRNGFQTPFAFFIPRAKDVKSFL